MLKQILQKYIDQPVKLIVYNSKSRNTRGRCKIPRQNVLSLSLVHCSLTIVT